MSKTKNDYFNKWRKEKPYLWHLIQAKWYHRVKEQFLLGQKKLSETEVVIFAQYEDGKVEREVLREVLTIDKEDKYWRPYGI